MSVILLVSGPGSPGVTTTALGLTLSWPRGVLLADCDPSAAQAIIAGHLRGLDTTGRGLSGIAQLHRNALDIAAHLPEQTVQLAVEPPLRRLLPGFTSPGAVRLFDGIWPELAQSLADLHAQEIDAVVDLGRIPAVGIPEPLLEVADLVGFVLRSDLRSLAAARLHLPVLSQQLARITREVPLGLVIVGPGRPYTPREIVSQFGIGLLAQLPWAPKPASYLSHGSPHANSFDRSLLKTAYRGVAQRLVQRCERTRNELAALSGQERHG